MASARDLRRRIKSIKSTQQITKAMKMVAAANLRKSQERVIAARPFAGKIKDVLSRLTSANSGVSHPLLEVREPNNVCYVLITGDRGLCGGYNSNIIRRNAMLLYDKPGAMVAIGRKGRDFFRRRGYDIKSEFVGLGDEMPFGIAKEIGQTLVNYYVKGVFDEVYLVYTEFKSAMTQIPTTMKLLPVEPPAQKEGDKGTRTIDYIYEPEPEELLAELLPKYIETTVYRALLESKASEYGARMTAMSSATENATEMIDKLTLSLNRARQAAITKEISEIVGGANALD
ncbi:ATP synthase F1 subunit gamma [Phosphitispora fastidiosa]|uniref:ATP synthase F1 subunit gamma n=1 Tax=Phosphitispora fastidiosa TaxID=2837202 RepID=UPI001E3EAC39|nr:ATP synthase F1 subunit gamma [Phosphitispora fastidiosa]MBU7007366.1 F-type H+-transporting ATPase subunit gamma [Phosphitispora fastidiosa]